jgi:hypothetical protein
MKVRYKGSIEADNEITFFIFRWNSSLSAFSSTQFIHSPFRNGPSGAHPAPSSLPWRILPDS